LVSIATPAISQRQQRRISDEGTRQRYNLMDLAATMDDVILLGRGDPDLPTPPHIVEAAKEAIDRGVQTSSDPAGLPELRDAIARKLWRDNGVRVEAERGVVVTTGGQEALYLLVQAILKPGDEVLVPDPRYSSYDVAIQMAGGVMVSVPTHERDNFDLDPAEVESRITDRTRALLLITPGNPTAGVVSPENIRELARIAQRHDIMVISDEIYEKLLYDGAEHLSIASLPGMTSRTITLNGFSKTYAMTGWRLGYVAGPAAIMRRIAKLKSVCSGCAPVVSQRAGVAAMTGPQDSVEEMRLIYEGRRRVMLDSLDRMGMGYGFPGGAFYVFINTAATGMDSEDLAYTLLRDGHVLAFPGTGFGDRWIGHMRISYLADKAVIAEAMTRIERVIGVKAPPQGGRDG
jgi:aminotransferase